MATKKCSKCGKLKPLKAFSKRTDRPCGYRSACKTCEKPYRRTHYAKNYKKENTQSRQWQAANADRWRTIDRASKLRRNYGLTLAQYNTMFEAQYGRCAICDQVETLRIRGKVCRLAVDHDHVTGKVRQLLCCKCNQLPGCAGEDPDRLIAAVAYLRRHANQPGFLSPPILLFRMPLLLQSSLRLHQTDSRTEPTRRGNRHR